MVQEEVGMLQWMKGVHETTPSSFEPLCAPAEFACYFSFVKKLNSYVLVYLYV